MEASTPILTAPPESAFRRLKAPALWLVILILAAMALLWFLDPQSVWEPPYVNVLRVPLEGGIALLIAGLAVRSFHVSGSWPVLWLGAGSLTFGLATALSISSIPLAGPNFAVTTNNLGVLWAATLYFSGAFFAYNGIGPREGGAGRRSTVFQVYAGAIAIVMLVNAAALGNLLPPFFVQGQGGTPWRQLVLVAAGLLFLVAGLTLVDEYRHTGADFLYWFGLGLVLIALVQAGAIFSRALGTPVSWLTRCAELLSALYLLAAVLVALRQARASNVPASEVLAGFFWRNGENVKLLFESISDAIVVTDRRFVITDWNRAAEESYGWTAQEAVGKLATQLLGTTYPPGLDRKQVIEILWERGAWRGELVQRHRDGREIPMLVTMSALRDAAGREVGTVSVNRDITKRVQLEEQLRQANAQIQAQAAGLERTVTERTAELRQAYEALQTMSSRLVDVQENERRALSRELHDESGQLLTAIITRLALVKRLSEQGQSPAGAIDELKGMANQLAEGLHRLTVDLRPASLDRDGLVAALEQYIESYRKTYGLQVDLLTDGLDGNRLAPELESSLYRIVQEALTNVARYARAGRVGVMLSRDVDRVTAVIEDDGIGFDVEAERGGRLGIAGMMERAELRGGSLSIESQPGVGTTVFVTIPYPPPVKSAPVDNRSEPS